MQETTCSTLTGRYLERSAWVRLMIDLGRRVTELAATSHLLTISAMAAMLACPPCTAASVASASRPRRIGFSKRFLNSAAEPSRPSFTKLMREKYSSRSFWTGVPERRTRLEQRIPISAE